MDMLLGIRGCLVSGLGSEREAEQLWVIGCLNFSTIKAIFHSPEVELVFSSLVIHPEDTTAE